jgi:hypothetical protein
MQEHRTQWNDMNNPEATEEQRVKSVSRETQVIAWPPVRPGRVLTDVFEDLQRPHRQPRYRSIATPSDPR